MVSLWWLKLRAVHIILTIRSEWYFAGERNESRAFRNYENQDVVMVITVKPCRHVDTPEVGFWYGRNGQEAPRRRWKRCENSNQRGDSKRTRSMRLDTHPAFAAFEGEGKARQGRASPFLQTSDGRTRFISSSRLRVRTSQTLRFLSRSVRDAEDWKSGILTQDMLTKMISLYLRDTMIKTNVKEK